MCGEGSNYSSCILRRTECRWIRWGIIETHSIDQYSCECVRACALEFAAYFCLLLLMPTMLRMQLLLQGKHIYTNRCALTLAFPFRSGDGNIIGGRPLCAVLSIRRIRSLRGFFIAPSRELEKMASHCNGSSSIVHSARQFFRSCRVTRFRVVFNGLDMEWDSEFVPISVPRRVTWSLNYGVGQKHCRYSSWNAYSKEPCMYWNANTNRLFK